MAGIFVSHAHADSKFLEPFIEQVLQLGSKLTPEDLFYSSEIDTGIPAGQDLNTFIKGKVTDAGLVIAVISPSFRGSPYCLAELGAAWAHVGKLYPIAIPGFKYSELDGVLQGVLVRHIDDSSALDELHDRVKEATGKNVPVSTWGRHKAKWLAVVRGQEKLLPDVKLLSAGEADRLRGDLKDSQDALAESLSEMAELTGKLNTISKLKNADEVAELLVPDGEQGQFNHLVAEAKKSIAALPSIVGDAVWHDLRGETMAWAAEWTSQTQQACEDGYLIDDGGELSLNSDYEPVQVAMSRVAKLDEFLGDDRSPEFDEWFRGEYKRAPGIRARLVWNKILL